MKLVREDLKDSLYHINILSKFIDEEEAELSVPTSSGPLESIKLRLRSAFLAPSKTMYRPTSLELKNVYKKFV